MGTLSKPVASWPLLLCGPILRRVTRQSVAVFVATSRPCRVGVEVYRGTSASSAGTLFSSAGVDTRSLGDRLHVAVVNVDRLTLAPGVLYGYDVRFIRAGAPEQRLKDLGLLSPPISLGYDLALPTFSLPASLSELVIAYQSCRKAHGEGLDAFPLVDRMIATDRLAPRKRPHLLILGGDQIYADDVPIALLTMMRDTIPDLFGTASSEALTPPAGAAIPFDSLPAGPRRADLVNSLGFTAGIDDHDLVNSHLLFRSEFYAMYLFQWSDALWPQTLPSLPDVMQVIAPVSSDYAKKIQDQARWLDSFRQALPAVRRALANVPTAMIFDDHDVTDDWNLHRDWNTRMRNTAAFRQVVRNALSAYTVFQDWGNDPDKYRGIATSVTMGQSVLASLWTDPDPLNVPKADLDAVFDLKPTKTDQAQRMRWDWALTDTDAGYRVIFLDTRTWRGFPAAPASGRKQAALIASDSTLTDGDLASKGPALGFQLLARGIAPKLLTFVVSATPVLGNPLLELKFSGPNLLSASAEEIYDVEFWAGNRAAFEDLLARLASFGRVVLLSGDVHYGFSAEASWFETPAAGSGRSARIVQLCSSAVRNERDLTRFQGTVGLGVNVDRLPELGWFGFKTDRKGSSEILKSAVAYYGSDPLKPPQQRAIEERLAAPCVLPDRHYTTPGLAEIQRLIGAAPGSTGHTDWRYLIRYLDDERQPEQRLIDAGLDPGLLKNDPHLAEALIYTAIVGVNNVGRVTVSTAADGTAVGVTHELHWWLEMPALPRPAPMKTVHKASLLPPPSSDLPSPKS